MAQVKGGTKLDAVLLEISRKLKKGQGVDVGFMGNATEEDGTPVALVAAMNEYGVPSRNQPPRPFFRNMIDKRSEAWPKNLATALKRTNYDAFASLSLVGLSVKEDLQASIRQLRDPPLADSTVRRKGFDKPLIDTSTMLNSVTYKVRFR